MKKYDAIVIGSGQAGVPLAKKLAAAGWKVALIEKALVGGTCVNYGCTPTKTMIASARIAYLARRGKEFGVPLKGFAMNMKTVVNRKDEIVARFHDGSEKGLLKTKHLDLIFGAASFTGPQSVAIALNDGGTQELTAKKIFIDTGTRTAIPEIEGLDTVNYLTSTTIMELTDVPKHLLIIGGSYIGLEFGQMFRRFGSKVTVLDSSHHFLPKEDEDIAVELRKILEDEGIAIHCNAEIEHIKKATQIAVRVAIEDKIKTIQCSHILVAAGRTPNTDRLDLKAAGVKTDERGYIIVNNKLETSTDGIYALGDVTGGPAFTHIAYNDFVVVAKNLIEKGKETTKNREVPYCMFTDPELGRVGLTEQEAWAQGYEIKIATLPMAHVARAIETGDTRGMMKAVIDAQTDKILGVAMLGTQGGELMAVLQMAMAAGFTHMQLRDFIFAHPTYSESINNLFMTLDNI